MPRPWFIPRIGCAVMARRLLRSETVANSRQAHDKEADHPVGRSRRWSATVPLCRPQTVLHYRLLSLISRWTVRITCSIDECQHFGNVCHRNFFSSS